MDPTPPLTGYVTLDKWPHLRVMWGDLIMLTIISCKVQKSVREAQGGTKLSVDSPPAPKPSDYLGFLPLGRAGGGAQGWKPCTRGQSSCHLPSAEMTVTGHLPLSTCVFPCNHLLPLGFRGQRHGYNPRHVGQGPAQGATCWSPSNYNYTKNLHVRMSLKPFPAPFQIQKKF